MIPYTNTHSYTNLKIPQSHFAALNLHINSQKIPAEN